MEQLNCAIKNCTVLYLVKSNPVCFDSTQFFHHFSTAIYRFCTDVAKRLLSPARQDLRKVGVESSTPFKTTNCDLGLGSPKIYTKYIGLFQFSKCGVGK